MLSYSRPVDGTRYFLLLENDSLVELTNTMRSFNKDGKTCVTYKFTHKKLNSFLSLGAVVNLRFSYKQYDQRLVDFITRSRPGNPYTSKVNLFQFAVNAGAGFEYLVNPKFALNAGCDYEIAPQFFGTYIDDHSRNMNHVFYLSALFKLKK